MTSNAAIIRNDEYYDFPSFKNFVLKIAEEMPEKTKPLSDQVAVACYIEPQRMASGLWRPESNQKESRWQATVGVIIAKGPTAFKYDGAYPFEGYVPQIGDTVHYIASDSRGMHYRGLFVRVMPSDLLKMLVDDSDAENIY